jgi:hypothetical protein
MKSQAVPRGFRRFIWAPKNFGKDKPDRDPLEVLRRFQQRLGKGNEGEQEAVAQWITGDLVHGDIIDEFVSSVVRGLDTPLEESKGGTPRLRRWPVFRSTRRSMFIIGNRTAPTL